MPSLWSVPEVPGSIALVMEDGGAVVHLRGEIDLAAVAAFEADDAWDRSAIGRVVGIDASQVTFFASSVIGLLLRMTRDVRAQGRRPLVRGGTRPLTQVFELTGLMDVFDVQPRPTSQPS